eukprot:TRINITY_DN3290_c0_g1_i1.p2 TRINITY_DN3290_c0_g1~~TRINITY_DN3290_c0_g1_i1.p2  ORF type:complete len:100 (-),score=3.11 TRINITY_DN3290_c0_g1_i1:95-394(-)
MGSLQQYLQDRGGVHCHQNQGILVGRKRFVQSKETIGDVLKKNPKIGELLPLPDELKRLSQSKRLMGLDEFIKSQTENVDLLLEGDLIWPAEEGITYQQ